MPIPRAAPNKNYHLIFQFFFYCRRLLLLDFFILNANFFIEFQLTKQQNIKKMQIIKKKYLNNNNKN